MAAPRRQGRRRRRCDRRLPRAGQRLPVARSASSSRSGLTSRIHRLLGIGFALLILPVSLGTTRRHHAAERARCGRRRWRACSTPRCATPSTRRRARSCSCRCPAELKYRAKPFIDVTMDRFAKGIGALLVARADQAVGPRPRLAAAQLRQPGRLRRCGSSRRSRPHGLHRRLPPAASSSRTSSRETCGSTTADSSTIETLVAELAASRRARACVYAIDLLESLDKRNLITPLLLYHESPKVRARALTALAGGAARSGREMALGRPADARRREHRGAARRPSARWPTLGGEAQTDLVRPYLDDANPRIAATAAAALAGSSKDEDRELAERTLTRLSGATRATAARRGARWRSPCGRSAIRAPACCWCRC